MRVKETNDAHVAVANAWHEWHDHLGWRLRLIDEISQHDAHVRAWINSGQFPNSDNIECNNFYVLWSKLKPYPNRKLFSLHFYPEEVVEIVERLFIEWPNSDPTCQDVLEFSSLVERVSDSMPPVRAKASGAERRSELILAVAASLFGKRLTRRRGRRARPLHAREIAADAALRSIGDAGKARSIADKRAGNRVNITVKGVEKARKRARRN